MSALTLLDDTGEIRGEAKVPVWNGRELRATWEGKELLRPKEKQVTIVAAKMQGVGVMKLFTGKTVDKRDTLRIFPSFR